MGGKKVRKSPFAANVSRYYAYVALHHVSLWLVASTWVIYLQQRRGQSMTGVTLIDAIFWLSMALSEMPTGVVADVFGRKRSLIIGEVLSGLGMLLYGLVSTFPLLIVANVIWAVALTFHSGAGEALLYESLRIDGRTSEYAKLNGRALAVIRGSRAAGSIVGGLLAAVDLVIPFFGAFLLAAAALAMATGFREPKLAREEAPQAKAGRQYALIVRSAARAMREHLPLRYAVLYMTIVPVASLVMVVTFLQPHAVSLGVPVAAVGVLVMAANGVSMVGSLIADWAGRRFGARRVLYAVPVVIIGCLIALGVTRTPLNVALIALIALATEAARPLAGSIIQDAVSDNIRATVLSVRSLLFTFVIAASEPGLGLIADRAGLPTAYLGLAGLLGLCCALLFWAEPRWLGGSERGNARARGRLRKRTQGRQGV